MLKTQILEAIGAHVSQRSGMNYRDYGDRAGFMRDYRRILRDGADARRLLWEVSRRSISGAALLRASLSEFSGRLAITRTHRGVRAEYTTGQYFATEYRAAACAILASALWDYFCECGYKTGDEIRAAARREFGRGIASRWFN